jgi:hypothetical protein
MRVAFIKGILLLLGLWGVAGGGPAVAGSGAADARPALTPFEGALCGEARCEIDRLVFGQLRALGIQPARLCSDGVFVRRVYLDVLGTLPTAQEAGEFLADRSARRRAKLIERLLEREEYADYWAMKWCDLLRVKAEFPVNLWPNAAQAYHRWIRTAIKENKPCDRFARELLTASGSNFRVPPANFYRAMQNREPAGIAQTVALTFMGARAEKWPAERLQGLAGFFSQVGYKSTGEWKEEIVFFDPTKASAPAGRLAVAPTAFPDGTPARLSPDSDPREAFADWLVDARNPWFARSLANRAWSWLLGRGIVHEPDDLRPDNPPSNPALLAHLEKAFVALGFDMKALLGTILNSQTYQLASVPCGADPRAAAQFARYPVRRLEAEVLIDALCQLTGTAEKYTSAIPEPFTFIPDRCRAVALPDGSITSAFLELFGRPARDTGTESERNNRVTAGQRLHWLNSSHVQRKLEGSPIVRNLARPQAEPRPLLTGLYLAVLSRFPTESELREATAQLGAAGSRQAAALDLVWALVNSVEFLHRH